MARPAGKKRFRPPARTEVDPMRDKAACEAKVDACFQEALRSGPWDQGSPIPEQAHHLIFDQMRNITAWDLADCYTTNRLNAMKNPSDPVCSFILSKQHLRPNSKRPRPDEAAAATTTHRGPSDDGRTAKEPFKTLFRRLSRLMEVQDPGHRWEVSVTV